MRFSIPIILAFVFTLSLLSCTEKIDIKLDSTYTRLVVDGAISDQPGPHQIKLSLTGDYFATTAPQMVTGAVVSLSDGSQTWTINETSPGVYETPSGFKGISGTTYILMIDEVEIDGVTKSYSAVSEMPFIPPVDSIQVEFINNWKIWGIKLYAWDPPTTEFYLFRVYRNGKPITDTINRWVVVSDEFFNGNYTFGVIAQFLREDQAAIGDTISLEMASISEDYAKFIWEVQEASGFNNPLFDGPPANVRSNLNNGAMGYFAAYPSLRIHSVVRNK